MTTLSRDNSMKCINLKKVRQLPIEAVNVAQPSDKRRNSFAEKLKKCTQKVLTFKSDVNTPAFGEGKAKLRKKISSESARTMSNSSLKEIDEEASSEVAQMMCEIKNGGGRISSAEISWCESTAV